MREKKAGKSVLGLSFGANGLLVWFSSFDRFWYVFHRSPLLFFEN